MGFVYDGRLDFDVERTELTNLRRPQTQIMMNVASPEEAFSLSFIPNDGVGLARLEFIVNNHIQGVLSRTPSASRVCGRTDERVHHVQRGAKR